MDFPVSKLFSKCLVILNFLLNFGMVKPFFCITLLYHIAVFLSIPKLISYSVQFFISMKTFHENFFIVSCSNSLPTLVYHFLHVKRKKISTLTLCLLIHFAQPVPPPHYNIDCSFCQVLYMEFTLPNSLPYCLTLCLTLCLFGINSLYHIFVCLSSTF
jgi:hypothetical protein